MVEEKLATDLKKRTAEYEELRDTALMNAMFRRFLSGHRCFWTESKVSKMDDNEESVAFEQKDGKLTVYTVPFQYGRNHVVRVAKIEC